MKCLWFQVLAVAGLVWKSAAGLDIPKAVTKTHITARIIKKDADGTRGLETTLRSDAWDASGSEQSDEKLDVDMFASDLYDEDSSYMEQSHKSHTNTASRALNRHSAASKEAQLKPRADPPPPTTIASPGAITTSTSSSTNYTRNCTPPCVFTPAAISLKQVTTLSFTNVTTAYCSIVFGETYKRPLYYSVEAVEVSIVGMAPVHVPGTVTSGQSLSARPTIAPPPSCSVQIPEGAFICLPPKAPIATDGKCGPKVSGLNVCPILESCSSNGECVSDQQHCNYTLGCQPAFGGCYIRWNDGIHNSKPIDGRR